MKYSERIYDAAESCVFRKTREAFGGLSNMATDYPLEVNNMQIPTAEALYQACRYPHLPEVQMAIIEQASPMTAKMKSKAHYCQSRSDWEEIKVTVMRWCLRVKLAQHFFKFGHLLESTYDKSIVEESKRDRFWGAQRTENEKLRGVNALGRLLMEIRQLYRSEAKYDLLYVEPPKIENFLMLGENIEPIDKRLDFILSLLKGWQADSLETDKLRLRLLDSLASSYIYAGIHDLKNKEAKHLHKKAGNDEEKDLLESDEQTLNLSLF